MDVKAPAENLLAGAASPRSPFGRAREAFAATDTSSLILVGFFFLSSLDRTVMSSLLQPIKQAFGLSDTAVGALSGLGFGIAYALLGLPFARIADVANRKILLVVAVGLWSGLTVVCGLAFGFWSFFLVRLSVGICEAASAPAMHALLADRYPAERRSGAASLISFGGTVGAIVGITAGGVIADHYGWRMAFWLAGVPGLLLMPVAMRFLRETRPSLGMPRMADIFGHSMWQACAALLAKPAFRFILIGYTLVTFWMWGTGAWFTTFLMRSHGMSLSDAAFSYGILSGVATALGAVCGGFIGNRYTRRDWRWFGWLPALGAFAAMLFGVPVSMVANTQLALTLYIVANVFLGAMIPVIYAAIYTLAGSHRRALGMALCSFFVYLIGLGLGPMSVGAISDHFAPTMGTRSLGLGLLITTAALPLSALAMLYAAKFMVQDMEKD